MTDELSGRSFDTAIKFEGIKSESEGVMAEYEFLAEKYGIPRLQWKKIKQSCMTYEDKRYDIIKIKLLDDSIVDIYFDITDWFGKHDCEKGVHNG